MSSLPIQRQSGAALQPAAAPATSPAPAPVTPHLATHDVLERLAQRMAAAAASQVAPVAIPAAAPVAADPLREGARASVAPAARRAPRRQPWLLDQPRFAVLRRLSREQLLRIIPDTAKRFDGDHCVLAQALGGRVQSGSQAAERMLPPDRLGYRIPSYAHLPPEQRHAVETFDRIREGLALGGPIHGTPTPEAQAVAREAQAFMAWFDPGGDIAELVIAVRQALTLAR